MYVTEVHQISDFQPGISTLQWKHGYDSSGTCTPKIKCQLSVWSYGHV